MSLSSQLISEASVSKEVDEEVLTELEAASKLIFSATTFLKLGRIDKATEMLLNSISDIQGVITQVSK